MFIPPGWAWAGCTLQLKVLRKDREQTMKATQGSGSAADAFQYLIWFIRTTVDQLTTTPDWSGIDTVRMVGQWGQCDQYCHVKKEYCHVIMVIREDSDSVSSRDR